ncbi:ubiquitin-like protein 5 [Geosmithia morbida]|uniref:Ubiquitin-like modifier HUB1 n=1 Tax=Geosmithia morbida TaxID=1094350 RepID=A0A9P5D280_9HYPO|nr:ubiquitin-like protein 5 [Geosmithia morbida]KAF4121216.1 ubiquitin-like protein 5 [Geosmithia morbida]
MADSRRRSRSRSPPRRAPKGSGGFRWKDSGSGGSRSDRRDGDRRDPDRRQSFRNRSPPRNQRGYDRDDRRRDDRHDDDGHRLRSPRRDRSDRDRPDRDRPEKKSSGKEDGDKPRNKEKSKKPAYAMPTAGQEMIIVNINDRLGTKSAIPCLPSDTVGQLKLMVAARIGREPGQIMLKRQGERPFKDIITLEDYGISNGVQLDLEVDTGD